MRRARHGKLNALEPKETRQFDLAPNKFGEWGKVPNEAVATAVLTLKLLAFEDPSGRKLGDNSELVSKQLKAEGRKLDLDEQVRALEAKVVDLKQRLQ